MIVFHLLNVVQMNDQIQLRNGKIGSFVGMDGERYIIRSDSWAISCDFLGQVWETEGPTDAVRNLSADERGWK